MKRFVLSVMLLSLALAFSRTSAQAQAAAESALLNAHSAATTAKAGSALGSVLNHVNQQLGGEVQQVTHPALGATSPREPRSGQTPIKDTMVRPGTTPAPGNLITSINGAEATNCVPTTPPSSTSDKTPVVPAPADCIKSSTSKPETQKYKSVVTVSFPNN